MSDDDDSVDRDYPGRIEMPESVNQIIVPSKNFRRLFSADQVPEVVFRQLTHELGAEVPDEQAPGYVPARK